MKEVVYDLKKNSMEIMLVADAFSSLTRISILEEIIKANGEIDHKTLAEKIGVVPGSITYHIGTLVSAGIVSVEDGKGLKGRKSKIPKIEIKRIVIEL